MTSMTSSKGGEKVKFEVEIKKSDLKRLRQFMIDSNWEPKSDESIIKELFYLTSIKVSVDVRDGVKVKKLV